MVDEQNDKVRLAIFGSGRGSTARAILEYARQHDCSYQGAIIVTNRPTAGILEVASEFGVEAVVIAPRDFPSYQAYTANLLGVLERAHVEYIALAGYLLKVSDDVISRYRGRIVNIHPALLPKFGGKGMYGIHVHRAVIAAGERCSGATVHIVTEEYDSGPIIEQVRIAVRPDDSPETLMTRVQNAERWLYPRVLDRCCRMFRVQKF